MEFVHAMPEPFPVIPKEPAVAGTGRARAIQLRERMGRFRPIYNAAWMVRHAELGTQAYREQKMRDFWDTCIKQLRDSDDIEALTYAVADALTLYRHGFPWEG